MVLCRYLLFGYLATWTLKASVCDFIQSNQALTPPSAQLMFSLEIADQRAWHKR